MSDTAQAWSTTQVRIRMMFRLRVSLLAVATTVLFAVGLRHMLIYRDAYSSVPTQFVAWGALAAVLGAEAVLTIRRLTWRRLRGVAIGVVLAASATSYLTLTEGVATYADWAYGTANWIGIAILFDRPLQAQLAFLAGHCALALTDLLLLAGADQASILRFMTGSVGVLGYPLCVAAVVVPLRAVASSAARSHREVERARTDEQVAAESALRRRQRITELADSTMPLLAGLADRTLDPSDQRVRQRCAIEAGRLRRLMAEHDTVADPLLHELRHCADIAERRGVRVELDARGHWPDLSVPVRRSLTDAPLAALATADSWARVTVVGDGGLVSVNVVADCGGIELSQPADPDARLETRSTKDMTWVEVWWRTK
ncbi:hypothetical protein BLA60_17880 [Actinophytocola xinjiangensis]|uniref:Signal transduction histidine kinase n=1 Tax=Actinophytocola xinjiangensis TaxID=485602 RepID=A0A7Z0WKQ6_9PSEU|nr:hypothetical protein [Actinophytocola xinjiangensis]OLF09666.1 hypothetical protein BLA60_17880 [Actinophytocola xinjiangensis]